MHRRQRAAVYSTVVFISLIFALPGLAQQPAINIIFDMHTDPLPQVPIGPKQEVYAEQISNANWVLDQMAPYGVLVSYLSCGEFAEMIVQEGELGDGAELFRRLYAIGGQIGSHSHGEYRAGANNWPPLPLPATWEQSMQSWQDNIGTVNVAITTALGSPAPQPIWQINSVKGAHLPSTESDYHEFMDLFGIEVREGGPEEDFYGLYNHHIMNPYRPATDNVMGEDLAAPFVVVPQGSVIGIDQVHHGIQQDMTTANVKRMFIQVYLNWRHADRLALPDKVWAFGWGSHTQDFPEGAVSRSALVEVVDWLSQTFVGQLDTSGSTVARWSTQASTAQEYFVWETANPGLSSFDSNGSHLDWADYQYLRPVAEELWEARHAEDLELGSGITAWRLTRGLDNIIVAFSDSGSVVVDLSSLVQAPCRIIGAESGSDLGTDPSSVVVDAEPVIVTGSNPGFVFVDDFETADLSGWS